MGFNLVFPTHSYVLTYINIKLFFPSVFILIILLQFYRVQKNIKLQRKVLKHMSTLLVEIQVPGCVST